MLYLNVIIRLIQNFYFLRYITKNYFKDINLYKTVEHKQNNQSSMGLRKEDYKDLDRYKSVTKPCNMTKYDWHISDNATNQSTSLYIDANAF